MVGQDMFGIESGDFIQHGQPGGRCTAIAEDIRYDLVLHHIARNQRAVRLNKGKFVGFGVCSAKPDQAAFNAAKVNRRFLVESKVGWPQYDTGE